MTVRGRGAAGRALGAILTLALTLAACGSSPGRTAGSGTTPPTPRGSSSPASCASRLTGKVNDLGSKRASGSSIEITAGDFFFSPTCVAASGTLTVTIKNTSQTLHNISVTTQNIDTDVPAGQSVAVTVRISGATVPFFCKYHTGAGMQGAFTSAS
jgi:plastocyanin